MLPRLEKNIKRNRKNQSYAPFLSVEKKYAKQKNIVPGPGYYGKQSSKHFKKFNNSMISYDQSPSQKSVFFRDKSIRFKESQSSSPGPAHCNIFENQDSPKCQNKEDKKEINNALRYYKDKFAHLFQQKKVVSIHCYTKMKTQPDAKEKSLVIEKTIKGNGWSSKQQRFKQKKIDNIPGPGQYNLTRKKDKLKQRPSPEFVPSLTRSFMDSVIYQSNYDSQTIPFKNYKTNIPGPATYNLKRLSKLERQCSSFDNSQQNSRRLRYQQTHHAYLSPLLSKDPSSKQNQAILRIQQMNLQNKQY